MNKKYTSLLLAGLMCFTSIMPTFAYDLDSSGNSIEEIEYQNTADEDYTNATNVFAELSSEYKVTIPKTIVLSGVDKKANYYVKVSGDIAGYETVNVIPDEEVVLSTKNKASQIGIITQDKTAWKFDNFDVDANGTVEASSLTAGKWSGTFNFNIYMDSHEDDEPIILAAGLYDENDNLIVSWDDMVSETGFDVSADYTGSSGTKYFKNYAFYSVTKKYPTVQKVVIPEGIKRIGDFAFNNYDNNVQFKLVEVPSSVTSIGKGAFYNCTSLTTITIPDSVTNIGDTAFQNCESLKSIKIPSSVTTIGERAFGYCTSLISVTISDSVTTIGQGAFCNCTSLTSIIIPDSITTIGHNAFNGCTSLKEIIIPDSVTTTNNYTFSGCTSLTSIIIPDSVTTIGGSVFSNCTSLASVTISDSVTTIGGSAFYGCTSLTSVTYNGTKAQWNAIKKVSSYKNSVPTSCVVHCTDGDTTF